MIYLLRVSVQFRPVALIGFDHLIQDLACHLGRGNCLVHRECFQCLLVGVFKISIHDQLFRRDLLHHHAQLELGDIADGNRLRAPLAQVAGNFHHGIIRHLRDAALVFHNDQIAVRIVIGNGTCHIHNKIAKSIEQIQVCFLLAAALADQLCLLDHP